MTELDIWAVPLNPNTEERRALRKKYGLTQAVSILITRETLELLCPSLKPRGPVFDTSAMTTQELRDQGSVYFQEADRLQALPDRKELVALRIAGQKDPLFIDSKEDTVRFWALQHPHQDAVLYKETWVQDPSINKLRILERTQLDNPVQTAQQNANTR